MFSWFKRNNKTIRGKGRKVFVGVSGGVDSSVSAAVLRDQGFQVVGVFIRTWQPDWAPCTWEDERRDAIRVCAHLNIPFVELDLEDEYKRGVADYMISEYRAGRTPNPDVMCNREVKFGAFMDWAFKNGADFVATGHYAQNDGMLRKGVDAGKDQTYFLWTLSNEQLSKILFPIGHLPKSRVRELAQKYELPTAEKKDSQGICFLGDIDMKEFLSHYIDVQPGHVVDTAGNTIGIHDGVIYFTLGERRGFTITKKTPSDSPYYVVGKDLQHNRLVVSQNPIETTVPEKSVLLRDCVWRTEPYDKRSYDAQIRYHGTLHSVHISPEGDTYRVQFVIPDYTLAPGQSVVVYDGDICIGGGIVS